jgi:succinate-semialdehyde dehydrogenase/glutarate-semialdehyde dehydrogenase
MLSARKIASALAAGCCIIIKPAEETPATAAALAEALHDAGLPAGVLSMVFGNPAEISEYLINAEAVRKVSLTGSSAVGKILARMAAETLTPCVLELGGHAPVLIFDDVDIDQTAKTLAIFKFRNAGQVCVSPSRFFVHAKIVDEFTAKFVKYTSELVVGDGIDVSTNVGPLAHERRVNDVGDLVEDAKNKGARCLLGGHKLNRAGYFYAPTVLTDVPANAELMQTEIFGPVAVLSTFDDIDDVLKRANDVPYGLASYLFTQNQSTIDYVRPRLDVGLVSINITTPILENVPFGGVKESGYGYEGGVIGLQSFQHFKLIHRG